MPSQQDPSAAGGTRRPDSVVLSLRELRHIEEKRIDQEQQEMEQRRLEQQQARQEAERRAQEEAEREQEEKRQRQQQEQTQAERLRREERLRQEEARRRALVQAEMELQKERLTLQMAAARSTPRPGYAPLVILGMVLGLTVVFLATALFREARQVQRVTAGLERVSARAERNERLAREYHRRLLALARRLQEKEAEAEAETERRAAAETARESSTSLPRGEHPGRTARGTPGRPGPQGRRPTGSRALTMECLKSSDPLSCIDKAKSDRDR